MESTTQIYLELTLESDPKRPVDGEAVAAGYEGRIDIDSFELSATAPKKSLTEVDKGSVVSNISFENMTISKVFDRSSLLLVGALNRHEKFKAAVISVDQQYVTEGSRKARNEILIMTLLNGYIADIKFRTSEGGQGASIKEDITLSFEQINIDYYADIRTETGKVTDDYRTDICSYESQLGDEQTG